MGNNLFALDIGTRTVIGIIVKKEQETMEVIAQHVETHKDRAMKDGQIHDVVKVAEIVTKVKNKLETKTGQKLTNVSIAAAGRTLRTVRGKAEKDLREIPVLTKQQIQKVEIEALANCKKQINQEYPNEQLYCVGYSLLSQKLNDFQLDTLEGQKGGYVELEIIATFLPNIVVDSLFEVLKRANLAIESLTLEPIAAMEVAIPPRFRMLNLALVDIGAGTSDIAISKGGTIIGYGMVQKAGDKITEVLAEQYLTDFQTAENLKINLSKKNSAMFKDIIGLQHKVTKKEFHKIIENVINEIAEDIYNEIIELNGTSPNAVFCVGGGSQVDLIREKLAQKLDIPIERIAVRDKQSLDNIKFNVKSNKLTGPEIVTPLGIGMLANKQAKHNFITVLVNKNKVTLFKGKKTTVAQGLFSAGVKIEEILKGNKTSDIRYKIQGEEIVVKGTQSLPGEIYVNNNKASLETQVVEGDKIDVVFPKAKTICINDIAKAYAKYINVNGSKVKLLDKVIVNKKEVQQDYIVKNNDEIEITFKTHLNQIIDKPEKYDIFIDGQEVFGNPTITHSQNITTKTKKIQDIKIQDTATKDAQGNITSNKEIQAIVTANGKEIVLDNTNPLVVDVFDKLAFDISKLKGKLIIKKNGMESSFSDPVKKGDQIKIYWE